MGAFEYTALDATGRRKRGVLEGDTPRQIRQVLRGQGFTPLSVEPATARETSGRRRGFLQRRISALELALFTRQLATLVRAGLPLEQALGEVAQQSRPRVERVVRAVRARVREGHSLATGLSEYPHVFSDLYRKTVEAGEHSGHLETVLERLADYTEQAHQMRQKTLLALFYPALLTVVALLVVTGLLAYVVPQVVRVFDNMDQTLPVLTRGLIALSDGVRTLGPYALAALLLLSVGARQLLKREHPRRRWHGLLLKLPLIGGLIRGVNAARFARTLSILSASSVPILDGLRISAQVLSNLPMRRAVEEAAARVREGSSIRAALEATGYFPPMILSLIASGEAGGKLEAMLERAADVQERQTETTIAAVLGLFEPLLILVMGAVVLVIVLAILLPIFELNQLVG